MNTETFAAPPHTLVIASRESRLAMWQAEHVRCALHKLYPSCDVKILGMTTRGDQILDRTLSKVGGKGLFVKELENALAESREVSSWPGDRLPVGEEMSRHVEKLTRRLKLETEAHHRLGILFKTAGGGHSVAAL